MLVRPVLGACRVRLCITVLAIILLRTNTGAPSRIPSSNLDDDNASETVVGVGINVGEKISVGTNLGIDQETLIPHVLPITSGSLQQAGKPKYPHGVGTVQEHPGTQVSALNPTEATPVHHQVGAVQHYPYGDGSAYNPKEHYMAPVSQVNPTETTHVRHPVGAVQPPYYGDGRLLVGSQHRQYGRHALLHPRFLMEDTLRNDDNYIQMLRFWRRFLNNHHYVNLSRDLPLLYYGNALDGILDGTRGYSRRRLERFNDRSRDVTRYGGIYRRHRRPEFIHSVHSRFH